MTMFRLLLPTGLILLFLAAYSMATNNYTKLPLPPEFNPQLARIASQAAVLDSAPVAEAGGGTQGPQANASAPAKAAEPTAACQCVNCQCDPCTCGQTQYQDVAVNETYYVQVCDGQTCRMVPRVRQVVRRVAVNAANVARAVAAPVRMNVSGGSTGTATSYQVYDSGDSYGSAGGTQYATTTRYYASSQSAGMPVRRVMARRPVRNALCRLFGCN